jgi:hypothetical protein
VQVQCSVCGRNNPLNFFRPNERKQAATSPADKMVMKKANILSDFSCEKTTTAVQGGRVVGPNVVSNNLLGSFASQRSSFG